MPGDYIVVGFECEKAGIDGFERANVRFVWEVFQNFTVPPKCNDEGRPSIEVVGNVWISDRGLADHLNSTYGLPARFSEVEVSITDLADVERRQWTWRSGEGNGDLLVHWPAGVQSQTIKILKRWIWEHENRLHYIDFEQNFKGPGLTSIVAGEIFTPTYSKTQLPRFVGYGSLIDELSGGGRISWFSDMECSP